MDNEARYGLGKMSEEKMNLLSPVPDKDKKEAVLACICFGILLVLGCGLFLIKDLKGVGAFLSIATIAGFIGWLVNFRKRKPVDAFQFENGSFVIQSEIENAIQNIPLSEIEAALVIRQKYDPKPLYCIVRTKGQNGYYGFIVGINNYETIVPLVNILEEKSKEKLVYEERDGWTFYQGRRSMLRKYEGIIKPKK
jgi:hypothetical protein